MPILFPVLEKGGVMDIVLSKSPKYRKSSTPTLFPRRRERACPGRSRGDGAPTS